MKGSRNACVTYALANQSEYEYDVHQSTWMKGSRNACVTYASANQSEYECDVHQSSTKNFYYTALSHKGWELPNSRIWLAEIDIDRGLDFPI